MDTEIDAYRKRLFEAQEATVRMRNSEWSEEQIKARCQELQNIIIEAEERPRFATDLGKIWNSKRNNNARTY